MRLGRYIIVSTVLVLLLFLTLSSVVIANPGLHVTNAILVAEVAPGDIIIHKMEASIASNDSPMDLIVEVSDLENISDEYSAKTFVTLDQTEYHLEPGVPQEIVATVRVPMDVSNGGKYAVVIIRQKPKETGVNIVVAVNVRLYLTVKDSQLVHTGEITNINAGDAISGKPVEFTTTFRNTGNHHFKFKEVLSISNSQGEELDKIYTSLSAASVIPSLVDDIKATYIPKSSLPLGKYSLKVTVMLDDGTVLDEAEGNFEVKEPYVPPPAPAKITLKPGESATLKTNNEGITILFPQGCVISQAEISVQNYPLEQIPAVPSGYNLATTCFRIDGLAGLLIKDAAITVKYTDTDLEKAGGDASRFRLARWDESDNKWTVLDTTVDKANKSLAARTNRFSIWAVMVNSPENVPTDNATNTKSNINWGLIGGIAAGIILVAGGVYIFGFRRQRKHT
jgi:hypothetical protein